MSRAFHPFPLNLSLEKDAMKKIILLFSFIICFTGEISFAKGENAPFPQIPGWKLDLSNQVYDPNNLWDIIDGAADLFLEYSFVDLHIARYLNSDSVEVKVELYRHKTSLEAFGMYSQERDPDYKFIEVGAQGYTQEGILNFTTGVYYLKLSTFAAGEKGEKALLMIAESMNGFLKQKNGIPEIFKLFPPERKILNAEQYVARNFLSYSFLSSASTALYKPDDNQFKAFIIELKNYGEAKSVLDQFLKTAGSGKIDNAAPGRYDFTDPNNGNILIGIKGKFLYGTINCASKSFGTDLLNKLEKNITE